MRANYFPYGFDIIDTLGESKVLGVNPQEK